MRSALLVLILCLTPTLLLTAQQEKTVDQTRIVVFTPTTRGNTYWPEVYRILEAAAEDLDIELLGHEFDVGDRFAKHTEGLQILRDTPNIDGARTRLTPRDGNPRPGTPPYRLSRQADPGSPAQQDSYGQLNSRSLSKNCAWAG